MLVIEQLKFIQSGLSRDNQQERKNKPKEEEKTSSIPHWVSIRFKINTSHQRFPFTAHTVVPCHARNRCRRRPLFNIHECILVDQTQVTTLGWTITMADQQSIEHFTIASTVVASSRWNYSFRTQQSKVIHGAVYGPSFKWMKEWPEWRWVVTFQSHINQTSRISNDFLNRFLSFFFPSIRFYKIHEKKTHSDLSRIGATGALLKIKPIKSKESTRSDSLFGLFLGHRLKGPHSHTHDDEVVRLLLWNRSSILPSLCGFVSFAEYSRMSRTVHPKTEEETWKRYWVEFVVRNRMPQPV